MIKYQKIKKELDFYNIDTDKGREFLHINWINLRSVLKRNKIIWGKVYEIYMY